MPRNFRFRHRPPLRRNGHPARVVEAALDYLDNYTDPLDALWDDDTGELWSLIGPGGSAWQVANQQKTTFGNETVLRDARAECRTLAIANEFCINGHENRINYIVGTGHSYSVAAKKDEEVGDDALKEAQAILDDFIKANRWNQRQQEIVRRMDRDGECFLRFFTGPDGLRVRFVEPDQVYQPDGKANDQASSWGIQTAADDVETVEGYWIDGKLVKAEEIQHRKSNVDCNVKRGVPTFWPVRKNLRRATKLLRNMSVVAEIQAAIALIRKHQTGASADISSMVSADADASVTNERTGKTTYHRKYAPGTILDVNQGVEYDFPAQGIDAGRYVAVLQAELRAIASRLVMPEFMLTSDASNANYSSTMVAEGPAVKQFQRLQFAMIEADLEVMDRVLDGAVVAGELDQTTRDAIQIDVTPPGLTTRNRSQEVAADMQLVVGKVMSIHTCQLKNELDPDTEQEYLDQEREEAEKNNPFAGLGAGFGGPDGGEGKEDGEEDGDDEDGDEDKDKKPKLPFPPAREAAEQGQWVTINGVHVMLGKDGTIKKGPKEMQGKKPEDVGGDGKDAPKSDGQAAHKTHDVKLPKSKKKVNISTIETALKQMGYDLDFKSGQTDLKTKTIRYKVKTPGGQTVTMDTNEIRDLVYKYARKQ